MLTPAAISAAPDVVDLHVVPLDDRQVQRLLLRLVRSQPALAAEQVKTFAALERELSAEVTRRQPAETSPVRSRLMAATFLASLRVSLTVWIEDPTGPGLAELVRESLSELGRGFA